MKRSILTFLYFGFLLLMPVPIGSALGASPSGGTLTRVSVASDGSQANGITQLAAISGNGRYVSFYSLATNLVTGDTNGAYDIFVRDRDTSTTTRVSVSSGGTEGNGASERPAMNADGRYVAFESLASNLVLSDTNGVKDVFVHDRNSGTTIRVSVATDGSQGNGLSNQAFLSDDGSKVIFESSATNLVANDTNGVKDIFVRDLTTNTTTRVNVATDGSQGTLASNWAAISGDGTVIGFHSAAPNFVPGDTNTSADVFVRDLGTGVTSRVSVASNGTQGDGNSQYGYLSDDGNIVIFESVATNLVEGDTNGFRDIFVHNRTTGVTSRISIATDGTQANGPMTVPCISGDGTIAAFETIATNLIPGDTNGQRDVFRHVLAIGETTLVSMATDGSQGNNGSGGPSCSGDGTEIAFNSTATNLVPGDTNGQRDIFVNDTGAPTSVSIGSFESTPAYDISVHLSLLAMAGIILLAAGALRRR